MLSKSPLIKYLNLSAPRERPLDTPDKTKLILSILIITIGSIVRLRNTIPLDLVFRVSTILKTFSLRVLLVPNKDLITSIKVKVCSFSCRLSGLSLFLRSLGSQGTYSSKVVVLPECVHLRRRTFLPRPSEVLLLQSLPGPVRVLEPWDSNSAFSNSTTVYLLYNK